MKKLLQFLKRWLPVLVWGGMILYVSTGVGSGLHTEKMLRAIFAWFHPGSFRPETPLNEVNFFARKSAHVIQFVIYALLMWRGLRLPPALDISPRRSAAWVLGSATVLALASEGIQIFTPLRTPLFSDVLLDVSGAVLGLLLTLMLHGIHGWRRSSRAILRPANSRTEPVTD